MWHSSYSTASSRSVTPGSTWSYGSDARKNHDLRTNRWKEDPKRKGGWNSRSEATGAARDEQLGGAQDFQQGLAMGTIREQRPDAALDVLGAACTSTGDDKNRFHQTC